MLSTLITVGIACAALAAIAIAVAVALLPVTLLVGWWATRPTPSSTLDHAS